MRLCTRDCQRSGCCFLQAYCNLESCIVFGLPPSCELHKHTLAASGVLVLHYSAVSQECKAIASKAASVRFCSLQVGGRPV